MEEIKNQYLSLKASCRGAEMQSLTNLSTGRECLWQGDPQFWGKRSPLLFPITGRMWNNRTEFNGREYSIPKHGFMQDRSFNLAEHTDTSLRYVFSSTPEELKMFPFDFNIEIVYTLDGNKVRVDFHVENCSIDTMPFQIGGHPGLNLLDYKANDNVHGYLSFEGAPWRLLRAGEQGCTEPDPLEMPMLEENLLPLKDGLFAHDALIFDEHQIKAITLHDKYRQPAVRLWSDAPAMLIWQPDKHGASFVCFEPWFGLCDTQHFFGPFTQRPYVNKALPGKTWHGGYTIECLK